MAVQKGNPMPDDSSLSNLSELDVSGPDEGPRGWLIARRTESYAQLLPRGERSVVAPAATPTALDLSAFSSSTNASPPIAGEVSPTVWRDRLAEYKRRKSLAVQQGQPAIPAPAALGISDGLNWRPLGPSVVLDGQTVGNQAVAGRVVGLAIAPGGQIVYAASAAGGVFRSDDGGMSWQSLMDGFDVDPTDFASASLACGAIALDPANPDRVYVGTGEGDTHSLFAKRVVSALPAYRGIGPIRTDDGGVTWVTEATADPSPGIDLSGKAFFALAVDPANGENVLAATTNGIYQRTSAGGGAFVWVRRRAGEHSSMVVASSGDTKRFFAAKWGSGVYHSTDGVRWRKTGKDFPRFNVGRIALGVQPTDPNLVYAFVADRAGALLGLYRLDSVGGNWKSIANVPNVLPAEQGSYDLAIAVDPEAHDTVYLGGDRIDTPPWSGSIWRCTIGAIDTEYRVVDYASIGMHAHADVHVLVHTPGKTDELWCGSDGGVFLNRDPRGSEQFVSRNDGLSCLHCNFVAQHPTDSTILFTGLQDNGTARTESGLVWTHVNGGDGGYCLINWHEPDQVLVFANGAVYRSTTGGATHNAWSSRQKFQWHTMTLPIVGLRYNSDPLHARDAGFVAVGAGREITISEDFGATWAAPIDLPSDADSVFALAFSSVDRLYVGTVAGQVFRADQQDAKWVFTRLDDVAAGPLGVVGLITDIAVDWADPELASLYVVFGGMGDFRHVWHFDGVSWEARSGEIDDNPLLDVEHNALVVDSEAPENLYAGADIGVWHSPDAGLNWNPLQNGLPDAPVFDLQIHPTQRLLRAATHGRGVYEIELV